MRYEEKHLNLQRPDDKTAQDLRMTDEKIQSMFRTDDRMPGELPDLPVLSDSQGVRSLQAALNSQPTICGAEWEQQSLHVSGETLEQPLTELLPQPRPTILCSRSVIVKGKAQEEDTNIQYVNLEGEPILLQDQ